MESSFSLPGGWIGSERGFLSFLHFIFVLVFVVWTMRNDPGLYGPLVLCIVIGLDRRWQWSPPLPLALQLMALVVVASGMALSIWAFIPAALLIVALVVRTALEDRTLQDELAGYAEYTQKVCYRMVPGIW